MSCQEKDKILIPVKNDVATCGEPSKEVISESSFEYLNK